MKKKITVKFDTYSQEHRSRALQIASQLDGVQHVGFQKEKEGGEETVMVVIGEGVDAVKLVKKMRNKVGWTKLTAVGEHRD